MVRNTESLLVEALQLPLEERAALVSRLLASLDPVVDEGVDEAWSDEIAQRLKDIDERQVEMIPWSQVKADIRKRIGDARGDRS